MGVLTSVKMWRRNPNPQPKQRQLGNRLSISERANVRRGFSYLVRRYETLDACAAAIEMSVDGLKKAMSKRRAQTYRLACLLARAADLPVEKILTGLWPGDHCSHCGGTGQ